MSLGIIGVGVTLVVVSVCLDMCLCGVADRTKQKTTNQVGSKLDLTETVGVKAFVGNGLAFEVRKGRQGTTGSTGGTGGTGGASGAGNSTGDTQKKEKSKKEEKGLLEKMLPMMAVPFLVSTSMIPMMLVTLKFMLLKSAFIGKIAILLMLLNMFRERTNGEGGIFTHNINANNDVAMNHYGYHGDEEYGAYVNKKRRRRR